MTHQSDYDAIVGVSEVVKLSIFITNIIIGVAVISTIVAFIQVGMYLAALLLIPVFLFNIAAFHYQMAFDMVFRSDTVAEIIEDGTVIRALSFYVVHPVVMFSINNIPAFHRKIALLLGLDGFKEGVVDKYSPSDTQTQNSRRGGRGGGMYSSPSDIGVRDLLSNDEIVVSYREERCVACGKTEEMPMLEAYPRLCQSCSQTVTKIGVLMDKERLKELEEE